MMCGLLHLLAFLRSVTLGCTTAVSPHVLTFFLYNGFKPAKKQCGAIPVGDKRKEASEMHAWLYAGKTTHAVLRQDDTNSRRQSA